MGENYKMHRVTRASIKDSDIDLKRVEKRLSEIAEAIRVNTKNNLTDINVICEEIFGEILNKIYDIHLVSLSAEVSGNFIAVDLVDYEKKIAYQVTSQNARKKIDRTIEKFNNSDLCTKIDELRFLILNVNNHEYRGTDSIYLKNGNLFSYKRNIMNFKGLMKEIEKKAAKTDNFLVEVYNSISMIYDSGRLKYSSIVKETKSLMKNVTDDFNETRSWIKGYGDIELHAFIPLTYKSKLNCMLQMRRYNLSGVYIEFDQDELINDYFVSEKDFEAKHNIGRYEDEEEMCMRIQNMQINLNAHTAYHIYKLFEELKEEYYSVNEYIDGILGTEGLQRKGNKYLLMNIDAIEWEEILFFARNHDWFKDSGEIEWNIFNNNRSTNSLTLSPNVNGTVRGDILAKISVSPCKVGVNKLNLYWEPGYKVDTGSMECFDNIVKWKADYMAEWIRNKLLKKAHAYYEKCNGKKVFWRKLWK